jgi:hypothetical protein
MLPRPLVTFADFAFYEMSSSHTNTYQHIPQFQTRPSQGKTQFVPKDSYPELEVDMNPRNCNDLLLKAEGNPLIVHFQPMDASQAPMVLIEVVMIQEQSPERQAVH